MFQTLHLLRNTTYKPLNKIQILESNLLHNYRYLSSIDRKIKIAPVLKSNAYGHGLVQVAKILDKQGASFFCIDSLFEALELLKAGIKTKILIMGYINPDNLSIKKLPFSYAVSDADNLRGMIKYQPHAEFHLFVDTGMHREGIQLSDFSDFLGEIKKIPQLNFAGLMSHLGAADKYQETNTIKQLQLFEDAQEIVRNYGFSPKWIHTLNSSGILHQKDFKKYETGNIARVGIAMYGLDPEALNQKLKPTLRLTSQLVQIKQINKGEKTGYDFTYSAKRDIKIGILPLGYNDGIDKRLSNRGSVLIDNTRCEIVGRVSMNITTINVSNVINAYVGQEVVVFSEKPSDINSIQNVAIKAKTIPYDLLVHLNSSIRREVVGV